MLKAATANLGSGVVIAAAFAAGWALVAMPQARRAVEIRLQPVYDAAFPPTPTLTVGDARARRTELNGQTVLYVEGLLHYAGESPRKSPGLKLELVGDDGRPLYTWMAKVSAPDLAPGQTVPFQTRLAAPPEAFKSISILVNEG